MLSKLHLKYRIFFGFLLVACFSLVVGGVGYFYLDKVVAKYDHVVKINMGNLGRMSEMRDSVRIIRSRISFIIGFPKGHETEVQEALKRIEEEYVDYAKADKGYNDIPFVAGEEEIYKPVDENWKIVKAKTDELLATYKKEGVNDHVLSIFFNGYTQATDKYFTSIEALMAFQDKESIKWTKESAEMAALSTKLSLIIMGLSFVMSLLIGTFLVKMLTGKLTNVITELNETTPQLAESASSMSSLSSELSSCATEQAAAVQETASSMEEISAMIKRNSDNANNAKASSTASLHSVKSGQQAVSNMLTAMEDINRNNDSFNEFMARNNEELSEMVKVITNISEKTKVINDIVFQTKLLSFNASVEAARAGEQGKGFAVVAEEVGNLAQMSGNAANEIKGLLEESIVKVNEIVSTTKTQVEKLVTDGKEKIETGVARARECDAALTEINSTVASVESLVAEVAHASGEQSQGISEVNKAMGQIDEVTNQNSIASQSVSTNAAQVMQLSTSIRVTSDKLVALLTGGGDFKTEVVKPKKEKSKPVMIDAKKDLKVEKKIEKPAVKEVAAVKEKMPVDHKEKVVPIHTAKKAEKAPVKTAAAAPMKKAVNDGTPAPAPKKKGGELGLPSYDDSRFEDV